MPKERTCVCCRKKDVQLNFYKVVKNKNGDVNFEIKNKLEGRGAYICKDQFCVQKFFKTRALNRAFKQNFSDETYKKLLEQLQE